LTVQPIIPQYGLSHRTGTKVADPRGASRVTAMASDKTLGTIFSVGIVAVIGWILLPSAGVLFLLLFVLIAGAAVWNRIRGR
jgi:hypothetical protein